jgi:hypothetical protein
MDYRGADNNFAPPAAIDDHTRVTDSLDLSKCFLVGNNASFFDKNNNFIVKHVILQNR